MKDLSFLVKTWSSQNDEIENLIKKRKMLENLSSKFWESYESDSDKTNGLETKKRNDEKECQERAS